MAQPPGVVRTHSVGPLGSSVTFAGQPKPPTMGPAFQSLGTDRAQFGQTPPAVQPNTPKVETPPTSWPKLKSVPWYLRPLVRLFSFLYLNPGSLQQWIPESLNPIPPLKEVTNAPNVTLTKFKTVDGLNLQGYWMPVVNGKSDKTIIMGHGYYGNAAIMVDLAKKMRERGYNVFLFDFRAHGKSQGKQTSIGFHEGKDIAAAVDYVKTHAAAQSKDLFYLGYSMGAAALMLSPKSLEGHPDTYKRMVNALDGFILDSPYSYLNPSENNFLNMIKDYTPKYRVLRWLWNPIKMPMFRLVKRLVKHAEVESQQMLHLPFPLNGFRTDEIFKGSLLRRKHCLQLHGNQDQQTAYDHGQSIFSILRSKRGRRITRFITLNADHSTNRPHDKRFTNLRDDETYLQALEKYLNDVIAKKQKKQNAA